MSDKKFIQLEQILALKFQKRQQIFSKISAEENRLRAQMMRLITQDQQAEAVNDNGIKAIGADVLWKAWVERSKTALNMELAQVLAQKERLLASVQRDYGKLLVSRQLLKDQRTHKMQTRKKMSLSASIDSSLYQNLEK